VVGRSGRRLWRDALGDKRPSDPGEVFKKFIADREHWVRRQIKNSPTLAVVGPPLEQWEHGPDIKVKRAANTSGSYGPAAKKLTHKGTATSSKQADDITIREDRVWLKKGALTTELTKVATPSAVEKGPWNCQIAECQQPKHQLRNCHALQELSEESRWSLVRLHELCCKCLEPEHEPNGHACQSMTIVSKYVR
jgi:hypothetical protein